MFRELKIKQKRQKNISLLHSLQRVEARITDAHIEFKSHDRYVDAIHRACITNRFATVPAMVLANSCERNENTSIYFLRV